jgi:hypothetical protein
VPKARRRESSSKRPSTEPDATTTAMVTKMMMMMSGCQGGAVKPRTRTNKGTPWNNWRPPAPLFLHFFLPKFGCPGDGGTYSLWGPLGIHVHLHVGT